MVEVQLQPLDLSCPAKKLSGLTPVPLCDIKSEISSSSRRYSHGSDDVCVTSTDRSPSRSPINCHEAGSFSGSDSDQPQDLSRDQDHQYPGPARKRFLSKFFKDPKGKTCPCLCVTIIRIRSKLKLYLFGLWYAF